MVTEGGGPSVGKEQPPLKTSRRGSFSRVVVVVVLAKSNHPHKRARLLIFDGGDETCSGTRQDLRMSYASLQITQHIYDRNEHSRLHSPSHCHMRSHTHSICSRHALQQVLIFSSTYRLRIAGDYALLMFVTCFDSIPTTGTTLDHVSTVRPSSSAYAQCTTIVKALPHSTTFHIASNAL